MTTDIPADRKDIPAALPDTPLPDTEPIDADDLDDIEPVGEAAQLYEHFRVVVDRGQEMMRVDKYLFDRLTNASRNRIQKAADAGFVMANGRPVKSSYKVKPLDVITIMMDRPRYDNEVIPEDIPLDIVYEDRYLMVVNKPAGLVVHPGHGNYRGTLVNAIAWHMKDVPDYDANDPTWGSFTASTRILPACSSSPRPPTPRPTWATSSSIRLRSAATVLWCGATSNRTKEP